MYYFFSLLSGILISVMVATNGGLAEQYGMHSATVIIHITGLACITVFILAKRERPFAKKHVWVFYLGGVLGVLTIVCNNLAFGRISVSAITALSLLGQSLTSLAIDQYGLFGMPKHPFGKRKLAGLFLVFCGIAAMIDNFEILAVAASLVAGVNVVITRTLNARLAALTSVRISTFYNYLLGSVVAIPIFLLLGRQELNSVVISPNILIYLGGVLGVCVVLASNILVSKISALYLSILMFVGQVFAGILVDALVFQAFSPRVLIGGVLVAFGMCLNLVLDQNNPVPRNRR